jgi:hypothetical protein
MRSHRARIIAVACAAVAILGWSGATTGNVSAVGAQHQVSVAGHTRHGVCFSICWGGPG